MPETFDEVIADIFTVKNDTIPPTAWPKLTCGVANEVTFVDSSLKLGDQREVFFQNAGQLRAAADLRFLTDAPATEKLRILPNGNVGIGTQTPAAKLQVTGGAIMPAVGNSNQAGIQFPSNPGGGGGDEAFIRYFVTAGETTKLQIGIGNDADDSIGLLQSGAERLTITSGRVGIGTAAPMRGLHVEPDEIHSGGSGAGFSFGNRETVGLVNSPTNGERWVLYSTGGTARLWSGGDKLFVTPNGSFGLNITPNGIAADRVVLHIAGSLTPAYMLEDTGRGKKWAIFTSAADGGLIFSDRTGFALHHLTIGPSGNVGVGTTVPTSKLHVLGDIRFTGNLIGGGKGGYVMDQFVNRVGATLEQGDVVVIGGNQTALYYGPNDNIPIPEVDLAQHAYDGCVCGIVVETYVELKVEDQEESAILGVTAEKPMTAAQKPRKAKPAHPQRFTAEELERLDRTKVESGQIGWMVTLGAFAHCKVDADIAPINIGDLLTTSPTKGHAQKALDQSKATGAIVGKALGSLKTGKGKIPVIVMLQ
jgi:hypothetical protein